MKNATKANVLFTTTVLVYIILIHSVSLLPDGLLSFNLVLVLPEIILLLPSLMYVIFLRPQDVESYGLSKVSIGTGLISVFMAFCLIPLVSLINMFSSFFVENSVDDTLLAVVTNNPMWLNLILIALVPAVVEEFIFRGLIFNGYKKRNPLMAMILSAFLFGLIHMNVNQFSYAFIIGIIFALLTYATGSIIPSTIAHFVINGNSVVMTHLTANMTAVEGTVTEPVSPEVQLFAYVVVIGVLAVMAAVGGLVAFFLFRYVCKTNRGIESVKMIFRKDVRTSYDEGEGKFFDGYLVLGIGLCLVYIIMYDFIL